MQERTQTLFHLERLECDREAALMQEFFQLSSWAQMLGEK